MSVTTRSYVRSAANIKRTFTTKYTKWRNVANVVWDSVNDLPGTQTVLGIFRLEEKCRLLFPRSLRHCNEPWTITFLVFQVWSFIYQIPSPFGNMFLFFFLTHGWIGECEFANPLGFWVWPCSRAIYLYRICTSCISILCYKLPFFPFVINKEYHSIFVSAGSS